MSWGMLCENCGWQEAEHDIAFDSEEEKELKRVILPGYPMALINSQDLPICHAFTYSDEELLNGYYTMIEETQPNSSERAKELEWMYERFLERGMSLPEGFLLENINQENQPDES